MKKKRPQIKAVLFDLGRVLVDFNFKPAYRKIEKKTGLKPLEIERFFLLSGLEVLFDGGKISSRRFYRQVRRGLGLPYDYAQFKAVWNRIFSPKPEMIRLAHALSDRYRLVLISNTNAMHYAYLRARYPLLSYFDRIILSFREKIRKPDTRIYRTAVEACRARPGEIFYIDDRRDLTQAARSIGIHAFTYKNNRPALIRRMRNLGIIV